MKIEQAIQQPVFRDARQKAGINLLYTASWFNGKITRMLKPFGITLPQFNILRILKGQHGKAIPLCQVTERMLDPMSNTSRLIDKLVEKGFVDRRQCPMDRRQVDLLLTEAGLKLIDHASEKVTKDTDDLLSHVCESDLGTLSNLLDLFRQKADQTQ
jgi:DNA-binding MarR family transcriptional regulator